MNGHASKHRGPWQYQGEMGNASVYQWGNTRALVELHRLPYGWHISVSCPKRLPTYDEIKSARYSLAPAGVTMAMIFPPPEEFVNLHPNCLHLYEIPGDGMAEGLSL